jgi:hypothetical protein
MASNNPGMTTEIETTPVYSASGKPVTRGTRVAFGIWMTFFLLTIALTIMMYLFDKFYYLATGR